MGDPVVHFEIGGADGARSRAFYAELFGWSVEPESHGYGVVSTGSPDGIGGGIMETPPGVPHWVTVYVAVADIERSLSKAEELGGKRVMGPTPVEGVGDIAMFSDPDGNVIGLLTMAGDAP